MILDLAEVFSDIYATDFSVTTEIVVYRGIYQNTSI